MSTCVRLPAACEEADALALVLERTWRGIVVPPAAVLARVLVVEGVGVVVDHHVVHEDGLRCTAKEPTTVGDELDAGDRVAAISDDDGRPRVIERAAELGGVDQAGRCDEVASVLP